MGHRKPAEFQGWPESLRVEFGPYRAVVAHHVDGDTFDCLVDLGYNEYRYVVVRLAGCDAPEKNRAATKEAGMAALDYLRQIMPVGARVRLITQPDPDSFGRYVAVVTMASGGSVAAVMVDAGHAVWKSY